MRIVITVWFNFEFNRTGCITLLNYFCIIPVLCTLVTNLLWHTYLLRKLWISLCSRIYTSDQACVSTHKRNEILIRNAVLVMFFFLYILYGTRQTYNWLSYFSCEYVAYVRLVLPPQQLAWKLQGFKRSKSKGRSFSCSVEHVGCWLYGNFAVTT